MRSVSPTTWLSRHGAAIYIAAAVAFALSLALLCRVRYEWPPNWGDLVVLAFVGALTWWLPSTSSDGRIHFTADNVVVLAAIPIVGPLGAGVVGLVMAALTRRRISVVRRLFNMAMASSSAMVGGLAYHFVGGSVDVPHLTDLTGALPLIRQVGLPIVVADVANLVVNALLVAGVIKATTGVPLRLQLVDMLTSSGPTQFAYGIIAFLVVIMWLPGDLDAVAILVALVPLAGARWALVQYGDERAARERALGALVSAIETRAPQLEGHSARVSTLAATMAQELGLGPKEVADVRTAGLLHDLGRVVVAPGQEGKDAVASARLRGVTMLQDLPFLRGASSLMEEVARAEVDDTTPSLAADLVRVADEYDLLRHGDRPVEPDDVIVSLRTRRGDPQSDRVLRALSGALHEQGRGRPEAVTAS